MFRDGTLARKRLIKGLDNLAAFLEYSREDSRSHCNRPVTSDRDPNVQVDHYPMVVINLAVVQSNSKYIYSRKI